MADKLPDDGTSEERIRVRAYEIFLRRGGQGGTPESDWLLAREELIKEADLASASPASPAGGKARSGTAPPPEPAAAPPKRSVRNVRPNTASRRSR